MITVLKTTNSRAVWVQAGCEPYPGDHVADREPRIVASASEDPTAYHYLGERSKFRIPSTVST